MDNPVELLVLFLGREFTLSLMSLKIVSLDRFEKKKQQEDRFSRRVNVCSACRRTLGGDDHPQTSNATQISV